MQYIILKTISKILCLLPYNFILQLGAWLGVLYYYLVRKQTKRSEKQLQESLKLSDAEKKTMTQQYQSKLQELNALQQKVQATVQSNIQSINQVMDSRIKQAAEQLRKENNLDVVLNKNSALAYDAKYDLTDKMIQKVNAIK